MARNSTTLVQLSGVHGIQLKQFPEELLRELVLLFYKVVRERACKDKLSEKVLNSTIKFRKSAVNLMQ